VDDFAGGVTSCQERACGYFRGKLSHMAVGINRSVFPEGDEAAARGWFYLCVARLLRAATVAAVGQRQAALTHVRQAPHSRGRSRTATGALVRLSFSQRSCGFPQLGRANIAGHPSAIVCSSYPTSQKQAQFRDNQPLTPCPPGQAHLQGLFFPIGLHVYMSAAALAARHVQMK
jgi:hypothetical protein